MTHLTEEDLILLYYGEPGAPPGARSHLAECPDCVNYLQSYLATIRLEEAAFAEPAEVVPEDLVRAILAARRQ